MKIVYSLFCSENQCQSDSDCFDGRTECDSICSKGYNNPWNWSGLFQKLATFHLTWIINYAYICFVWFISNNMLKMIWPVYAPCSMLNNWGFSIPSEMIRLQRRIPISKFVVRNANPKSRSRIEKSEISILVPIPNFGIWSWTSWFQSRIPKYGHESWWTWSYKMFIFFISKFSK